MDNVTAEESNINYYGLINQGATCYLNSVLQVLFMTKDFREAVTRFSDENSYTEFDHHLKALFDELQKHTARPSEITKKLGIDNVHEQRDAAEYFERVLRETNPKASEIFRGLLANKITCHNCDTETDRDAPFWHLPLSLVDSCSEVYSVVKGIEEFFSTTELTGENQMYCDHCDDKVDATIADVIKHHPDVLILLLKRFEFSYDCMSYVKINCFVEVPYTLQIPEEKKSTLVMYKSQKLPKTTYELYAVVDHFGDLRGGHYTATIKIQKEHDRDKEDAWYEFDDTKITPQLKKQPSQKHDTVKSKTVYLLFYKKKKDTQNNREVSTIEVSPKYCQETEQTGKTEEGEKKTEHLNASADKDLDEKRMDIDAKEDRDRNISTDKQVTRNKNMLTIYDYYCDCLTYGIGQSVEKEKDSPAIVGKAGYKERMKINVAEDMAGKAGADESGTGVCSLKLNKPPLPEQQKQGTKRKEDSETISSNPNKKQKVFDAEVEAAGIEHAVKDPVKQKRMKKGKVQEK